MGIDCGLRVEDKFIELTDGRRLSLWMDYLLLISVQWSGLDLFSPAVGHCKLSRTRSAPNLPWDNCESVSTLRSGHWFCSRN